MAMTKCILVLVLSLTVFPQNLIFRFLQSRARVQVWLYENQNLRIEGHIIGFDEYMNVMLDQSEEVHMKKGTRKAIGEYEGMGRAVWLGNGEKNGKWILQREVGRAGGDDGGLAVARKGDASSGCIMGRNGGGSGWWVKGTAVGQ